MKQPLSHYAPHFIPHRHLEAIGNLASYWSWFEIVSDSAIWALLGVSHHTGVALTQHVGIITKIDTLKVLADQALRRQPKRLVQLEQLIRRIEPVRRKRNTYVHLWWFYSPKKKKPKGWKITAKGEIKISEVVVPLQDIEAAAYAVWQLTIDWMCFLQATFPRYGFPWQKIPKAVVRARNKALRSPPPNASHRKRALRGGEHILRDFDGSRAHLTSATHPLAPTQKALCFLLKQPRFREAVGT